MGKVIGRSQCSPRLKAGVDNFFWDGVSVSGFCASVWFRAGLCALYVTN